MKQQPPFHKNDRIRIKNYVDPSIYGGMLRNGNEAWVRDIKYDQWGLPIIQIEWDKNHWTYNGAPDGWTFPDHFDKIETANDLPESKPEDEMQSSIAKENMQINKILNLQRALGRNKTKADRAPDPGPNTEDSAPPQMIYPSGTDIPEDDLNFFDKNSQLRESALMHVMQHLIDVDSFILIGVRKDKDAKTPEKSDYAPFAFEFALSPESRLMAKSLMADLAVDHYKSVLAEMWDDIGGENA